jgi:hypothetical protein
MGLSPILHTRRFTSSWARVHWISGDSNRALEARGQWAMETMEDVKEMERREGTATRLGSGGSGVRVVGFDGDRALDLFQRGQVPSGR